MSSYSILLVVGGVLTALTGLLHSVLGERLVLGPLSRNESLPRLIRSRKFMMRTLRFTWHIMTVLLICVAAVLWHIAGGGGATGILMAIALTLLICAILSGWITRGRHFSWALFLGAAVCVWLAT